jgi:tetratricopeptide (TPR) repeat protein
MRSLLMVLLLASSAGLVSAGLWAQSSSPSAPPPSTSPPSSAPKPAEQRTPSLAPPRSDRVNAADISNEGMSSSKDTQIDLSPPADDAKVHPKSSEMLEDEGSGSGDVGEFHPWDPHKAAKDVEVGDFYFKKKNYAAAEDRYREALLYKDNDAIATYRLAVCLEKMNRPDAARTEFEAYLKILPHGPQSEDARKAIEKLKEPAATNTKSAK